MVVSLSDKKHQYLAFSVKLLKLLNLWRDGRNNKNKWTDIRTYYIVLALMPALIPGIYDGVILLRGMKFEILKQNGVHFLNIKHLFVFQRKTPS